MMQIIYCDLIDGDAKVFETNDIDAFLFMTSSLQYLGNEIIEISGRIQGGQ